MGFPLVYLIVMGPIFDIAWSDLLQLLLTPSYLLISAVAIVTGYGLFEMKWWSWYVFLAFQPLLFAETLWVVIRSAQNHHKYFVFSLLIGFQLFLMRRIFQETSVPYLLPKIRWWESNPRYRFAAPTKLTRTKTGDVVTGEILDISPAGCFIKNRSDFLVGEVLLMRAELFSEKIELQGSVVWISESAVTHPQGIGVRFFDLSKSQKRSLKLASKKLKQLSLVYRRYRYLLTPEEFLRKYQEAEKGIAK
jgi:hypothetical protein